MLLSNGRHFLSLVLRSRGSISRWKLGSRLTGHRQQSSTAPTTESKKHESKYYMYTFGAILVAANVFTVWQEFDAHNDETHKLRLERKAAWEKEEQETRKHDQK
ncbi:hypothetical protein MPSEU_000517200 [Mayamaea pseudoterrestris]|nr:hypothetical protein MPSEU_000517200 [Mayamaea pseudoterrestris]